MSYVVFSGIVAKVSGSFYSRGVRFLEIEAAPSRDIRVRESVPASEVSEFYGPLLPNGKALSFEFSPEVGA